MANTHRAPRQWPLNKKEETISSYESWRQNLLYTLSCDPKFTEFLKNGAKWEKKKKSNATTRGFTDDGSSVPEGDRLKATQKCINLELMLGQIANYCPVVRRTTIVNNSKCLNDIWQDIRLYYGFQSSGGHFLDFADIKLQPDQREEELYLELCSFIDDNLQKAQDPIQHHGETPKEDEEIQPTLENLIVLLWLQLIHPNLPKVVKQRYGTELRSRTLASIKPEISQALSSLLEDARSHDSRIMRTFTSANKPTRATLPSQRHRHSHARSKQSQPNRQCPICHQASRPDRNHYLSQCEFLPDRDRKFMTRARQIGNIFDEEDQEYDSPPEDEKDEDVEHTQPVAFRIQVRQSPYLDVFYKHHPLHITIDSGATGNMMSASTTDRLGLKVHKTTQKAHQADGSSPLIVLGETRLSLTHDTNQMIFEGLVIQNLDVDVLAGTPFMELNDVAIRPSKKQVTIGEDIMYTYSPTNNSIRHHSIRRAHIVRAPSSTTTIWPGEYIEVDLPSDEEDGTFAIEPKPGTTPSPINPDRNMWPSPFITSSVARRIRIPNLTTSAKTVTRNSHFCKVLPVFTPKPCHEHQVYKVEPVTTLTSLHSASVQVDPDNVMTPSIKSKFLDLLQHHDDVFNPKFEGYNGNAGPFKAVVNMGPVQPPQRKGRVPQYSKNRLVELQEKFDMLESLGVFKRPEDVGVQVEYMNPSFLVNKPNGKDTRLVTAFADVGRYSKPQPSMLPDVDSILRQIGQWKFIIATDLSKAFYQIPLDKESMKYCGVATPFKGTRVYVRSAMGMPGSETALEELMCRILGDLLQEGVVTKLADDLYCGADTAEDLLDSWGRVLLSLKTMVSNYRPPKRSLHQDAPPS